MVRTNSNGSSGSIPYSGVPSTCTRWLTGTDSGYGFRFGQLRDQAGTLQARLAHADDAAAADLQARFTDAAQRVQASWYSRVEITLS